MLFFLAMLPGDPSQGDWEKANALNFQIDDVLTGCPLALEKYMDSLSDQGVDAEYWVGRAEWMLAQNLNAYY